MKAEAKEILFSPFDSPKLKLNGRVTMAPMTRLQCTGGVPDERVAAYYRRRAENGVSFIMSEGVTIDHPSASPDRNAPSLSTEDARIGWGQVLAGVHDAGAKMGCQLWHAGTVREPEEAPHPEVLNSAPSEVSGYTGRSVSEEDAQEILDAYVRSARFAREAGFDAVEIHCAHGYLLDLFLWPRTNRRSDRWGECGVEGHAAFPLEVIRQVRRELGEDFPILARFSQWKRQDFEARLWATPAELDTAMGLFVEAGVDIFDCSLRRFWEPEYEGSGLNLAGWIKRLTGKPTIAVGSVGLAGDFLTTFLRQGTSAAGLGDLCERMDRGEFDLIAVGRALMNDPAWLTKVKAGDPGKFEAMPADAIDRYR